MIRVDCPLCDRQMSFYSSPPSGQVYKCEACDCYFLVTEDDIEPYAKGEAS